MPRSISLKKKTSLIWHYCTLSESSWSLAYIMGVQGSTLLGNLKATVYIWTKNFIFSPSTPQKMLSCFLGILILKLSFQFLILIEIPCTNPVGGGGAGNGHRPEHKLQPEGEVPEGDDEVGPDDRLDLLLQHREDQPVVGGNF